MSTAHLTKIIQMVTNATDKGRSSNETVAITLTGQLVENLELCKKFVSTELELWMESFDWMATLISTCIFAGFSFPPWRSPGGSMGP